MTVWGSAWMKARGCCPVSLTIGTLLALPGTSVLGDVYRRRRPLRAPRCSPALKHSAANTQHVRVQAWTVVGPGLSMLSSSSSRCSGVVQAWTVVGPGLSMLSSSSSRCSGVHHVVFNVWAMNEVARVTAACRVDSVGCKVQVAPHPCSYQPPSMQACHFLLMSA